MLTLTTTQAEIHAPQTQAGSDSTISILIVLSVVVMIMMLKLLTGAIAPVKDVVRSVVAGLGVFALAGFVLILLFVALVSASR
jgi:hypothetical protein